MKAFITKYALTHGIQEVDDAEISPQAPSMISVRSFGVACFHGEGKDWHRSREGAVTRAEEMRVKKIASLQKKIIKLGELTFS